MALWSVVLTLLHGFQTARGPTQASYAKSVSKALFLVDKTAGALIPQLPLGAEFKNACRCTPLHTYLHGMTLNPPKTKLTRIMFNASVRTAQ